MGTRHTLLAVLCYSVPHVDASQQIATFGGCTFDRDDAGGSFIGSQAKKEVKIYSTNLILWHAVTLFMYVFVHMYVYVYMYIYIYIFMYIYIYIYIHTCAYRIINTCINIYAYKLYIFICAYRVWICIQIFRHICWYTHVHMHIHILYARINVCKYMCIHITIPTDEFGHQNSFPKLSNFPYILLNLQISGVGSISKSMQTPEKKIQLVGWKSRKHSEPARTISKIEKRREFFGDGDMNNARRILQKDYTLSRGCCFWSKKPHVQKNFDANFIVA